MGAGPAPLGAGDCERLRSGWVAQPANAGSSGVLALVGVWLVVRALRVRGGRGARLAAAAFGLATVVAGLGSVDYHGVQTSSAKWTHDGGAALLVVAAVAVPVLRRLRGRPVLPGWSAPRAWGLGAVAVVAGLSYLGGRSGSPLCSPDSAAQLHSLWHLCIGGAAAVWAVVLWPADLAVASPSPRTWALHPVLHRLVLAVTSLVYRRIDSDDLADLDDGPVVLVANHFGGLADALVLMAVLPRRPRILADDSIWRVPVAGWVMRRIGAVPVHRGRAGDDDNTDLFASTHEALRDGDLVLIFPEGVTRVEPSIGRIHTGAARIALGAGVGLRVVAVGLHYADRAAFRSDVAVRRGGTIDVAGSGAATPEAVDALTSGIEVELRRAAPNYEDWDEVAALRRAAEVALEEVDPDRGVSIGERERLASAYAALPAPAPARIVEAVRELRASGGDRAWHPRAQLRRTLLVAAALVLALPYAVVGALVFGIPVALAVAASHLPLAAPVRATIVPLVATLAAAAAVAVASVGAWQEGGWRFVGIAWALLPVTLAALVLVAEHVVLGARRAWARVRPGAAARAEVARRRLLGELVAVTGVALPGAAGSGAGAPGAGEPS